MGTRFAAVVTALAFLLTACSSTPSIEDFDGSSPAFVPEELLVGKTKVWGIFQDRFGKVRRQFVADVTGSFDGEVLTLDERFDYADGEQDTRIWKITKLGDGRYEGEANDVIGKAKGEVKGQAFHLSYYVDIDVGEGSTWRVHFDDWLLLQPDGVVVNRAIVTKYGIKIGELSAFFQRVDDQGARR